MPPHHTNSHAHRGTVCHCTSHTQFRICVCVTQALQAGTATKTLTSVRSTPQFASMALHATTLVVHSCVHVPLHISAATVLCIISVTLTTTTATGAVTVASMSATTTLRSIPAAVTVAGLAANAKKLWWVTIPLSICEDPSD